MARTRTDARRVWIALLSALALFVAGSQILATDLNHDGVVDIVTSGTYGAFAFFGKPRAAARPRTRQ